LEYPLAIVLVCLICPPRALYRAVAPQTRSGRSWNVVIPLIVGAIAWTIVTFISAPGRPAGLTMIAMAVPILICIACVHRSQVRFTLAVTALLLVAMFAPVQGAQLLKIHRTFFGIHRVVRSGDGRFNELFHGTTLHGREVIAADAQDEPLTYYHHDGPLGSLFAALPSPRRKKVAIIGLGVGSIAAYATAGDSYSFFEIDPAVARIADGSGYFHFLSSARDRGATLRVTLGDARLTLSGVPRGAMNLVVLDAFSGDAIPLHLLTREALAMYLDKLDEHGLLAVHISNLYLDLEPVVARLAQDAGCVALCRQDLDLSPAQWSEGKTASKWMLIARRDEDLAALERTKDWQSARARASSSVWTDDFSNVLSTLR
jgi:spermidine synthase